MNIPAHILRQPGVVVQGGFAKARVRPSGLNRTEERYRDLLELRKRAGEIQDYFTQAVTFKLGADCRYSPDFLIIENDGSLTFIEVKGFMREDAQVKFNIATSMFWWARFKLVRRKKGEWVESEKAQRDKRANECGVAAGA